MLSGLVAGEFGDLAPAPAATAQVQQVSASPASLSVTAGQAVSLDVNYTTSPANPYLNGLGVRMHYNSSRLTFSSLTSVLRSPTSNQPPADDTNNYDNDPTTDKYVLVAWSDPSGSWPGSLPVKLYTANFTANAAAGGSSYVRFSDASVASGWSFASTPAAIQWPSSVVARRIFYNHSSFDGNDASANVNDDGAIATDKIALRPGQAASFANYTSYSRGINGLMIDFDELPGTPTLSDLQFRVGNTSSPSSWNTLATTPTILVRSNVGTSQVDRLTLVWPDGAIVGKWLQVTVLASTRTGLSASDVFYFGNSPGESGNCPSNASVEGADYAATRSAWLTFSGSAAITNPLDFNRDGLIDSTDVMLVRSFMGHLGQGLKLFTTPSGSAIVAGAPAPSASVSAAAAFSAAAAEEVLVGAASVGDAETVGTDFPLDASAARVDTAQTERAPESTAATPTALVEPQEAATSAVSNQTLRDVASRMQPQRRADLFARDSVFEDWDVATSM